MRYLNKIGLVCLTWRFLNREKKMKRLILLAVTFLAVTSTVFATCDKGNRETCEATSGCRWNEESCYLKAKTTDYPNCKARKKSTTCPGMGTDPVFCHWSGDTCMLKGCESLTKDKCLSVSKVCGVRPGSCVKKTEQ